MKYYLPVVRVHIRYELVYKIGTVKLTCQRCIIAQENKAPGYAASKVPGLLGL